MKNIGYASSEQWDSKIEHLSAPTEIHFSITNKCNAGCPGCYVSSGLKLADELSFNRLKKSIDKLHEIGVFHVAFGGGEPTTHPNLIEIAEYCREKGIVPNITTNGIGITEELAKKFKVFEQIHISLDGLEDYYEKEKSRKTFKEIDKGISLLRKYNDHVGLNVVLSQENFDIIDDIASYAESKDLEGMLILRYKPAGRGKNDYFKKRLSHEQNLEFFNLLNRLHRNHKIKVYIDCSCVPLLSSHNIPEKALEFYSVMGCDGGNMLIGINPQGMMNACSFADGFSGSIFDFEKEWDSSQHFNKFRDWSKNAPEPCKSCKYLKICKGGCHVVSEFVTGSFHQPDPECPRVVAYHNMKYKKKASP
jgi:radical SAM protein with 4Fe4S-binding SPASM domain